MSTHNSMNNHNKVGNQQCCNKFQEVIILCKICFSRCTVSKTRQNLLLLNYLQILWFLSSIFSRAHCLFVYSVWAEARGPANQKHNKSCGNSQIKRISPPRSQSKRPVPALNLVPPLQRPGPLLLETLAAKQLFFVCLLLTTTGALRRRQQVNI